MKTTFKPTRGHNYHVLHESKTGMSRLECWSICGDHFMSAKRGNHQPTCPGCTQLDNPLRLKPEERQYLADAARLNPWRDAPKSKAHYSLRDLDFITVDAKLTRRGAILAEDFELGAAPMADAHGLMHMREPLAMSSKCAVPTWNQDKVIGYSVTLVGASEMTVDRYEKLRKVNEDVVVTCLACLAK